MLENKNKPIAKKILFKWLIDLSQEQMLTLGLFIGVLTSFCVNFCLYAINSTEPITFSNVIGYDIVLTIKITLSITAVIAIVKYYVEYKVRKE